MGGLVSGLISVATVAALVMGCSGGTSTEVPDPSSGDSTPAPGGASLPKQTDSAPAKGALPGGASAPSGGAQNPAGKPAGQPAQPAQPGDPGQNGQPGQSGRISIGDQCCYNSTLYTCDSIACFGGFDEEACENACKDDFDCIIACVEKLDTAPSPTAACKPTGKC